MSIENDFEGIIADSFADGVFVRMVRTPRGPVLALSRVLRATGCYSWMLGVVRGGSDTVESELAGEGAARLAMAVSAHVLHRSTHSLTQGNDSRSSVWHDAGYCCVVASGVASSDGFGNLDFRSDVFEASLERDLWED